MGRVPAGRRGRPALLACAVERRRELLSSPGPVDWTVRAGPLTPGEEPQRASGQSQGLRIAAGVTGSRSRGGEFSRRSAIEGMNDDELVHEALEQTAEALERAACALTVATMLAPRQSALAHDAY